MEKSAKDQIVKCRKEGSFSLRRLIINEICFLFFVGKMFKSAELPWLIQFFQMFYNDKPGDWLLDHLIFTKVCNWDKNSVSYTKASIFRNEKTLCFCDCFLNDSTIRSNFLAIMKRKVGLFSHNTQTSKSSIIFWKQVEIGLATTLRRDN